MSEIIGHQKIISYFERVIAQNNLAQAYCLVGSDQVGRETVARTLAARILQVDIQKLAGQPDWFVLKPGVDEKTGKSKKDISVDQIRDCQKFVSEFSLLGGYRIVLIKPAETLSLAAANGLLKILEEPKNKLLFFLITVREKALPATVRSRCQMIYFAPVSSMEISTALVGRGVEGKEAEVLAKLSGGLPGRALAWLADNDAREKYQAEQVRFRSLFGESFHEKIKRVEELFGDKSDHIATRENLQGILINWQIGLRDLVMAEKVVYPTTQLIAAYDAIKQARQSLRENVHPRMLVERILLLLP